MAKFSVWRDEDEEEDDHEFCAPSPKRRRTSDPPSSSASNSDDHHNEPSNHLSDNDHNRQQQRSEDVDVVGESDSSVRGKNSGGPMSVILSDPDVLDCSICFEPLTIPVFQCDNGHIACSSCCNNLGNKCPSCCGKIGNNRCRAIEKVVESVRVSCCYIRYGCRETVSYCKKHKHEEKCLFAPCSCPFPSCLFRASPRKLSHHICREHSDLVIPFRFDSIYSISVGMDESPIVLKEEKDGVLFVLSHGNTLAIRCMDPSLPQEGFKYDIVLRKGCSSLKFQSSTHCATGQLSDPPSMDYVVAPGYFYHSGGCLELNVCLWSKDALI